MILDDFREPEPPTNYIKWFTPFMVFVIGLVGLTLFFASIEIREVTPHRFGWIFVLAFRAASIITFVVDRLLVRYFSLIVVWVVEILIIVLIVTNFGWLQA